MGEEPDAHHHAQPGGLHGASHLRAEHELHGRPGETLALFYSKCFMFVWIYDLFM